jgi:hypothetical protein
MGDTRFKNYFRIQIPVSYIENPSSITGWQTEVFWIPKTALENKEYPKCKCGRRYVPIHKEDKKCFFCQSYKLNRVKI